MLPPPTVWRPCDRRGPCPLAILTSTSHGTPKDTALRDAVKGRQHCRDGSSSPICSQAQIFIE